MLGTMDACKRLGFHPFSSKNPLQYTLAYIRNNLPRFESPRQQPIELSSLVPSLPKSKISEKRQNTNI